MPSSQLKSKPIGYEPPSRSIWANPFQWTAETEYGRKNLKMNEVIPQTPHLIQQITVDPAFCGRKDRHWRRISNCKATTVCRQDGGKFITKGADQPAFHRYPKTSEWETMMFKRKRQLWKPQPDAIHKRMTEDRQLLHMLEDCKPRVETQLSEHILRYRLHRLRHPNFLDKVPPLPCTVAETGVKESTQP